MTLVCIQAPGESNRGLLDCFTEADYLVDVKEWENKGFSKIKADTDYFGIFYTAERLEKSLVAAIPIFLSYAPDVLILWKKTSNEVGTKFYRVPRVFKRRVALKDDSIDLVLWEGKSVEIVLDGWVTESA